MKPTQTYSRKGSKRRNTDKEKLEANIRHDAEHRPRKRNKTEAQPLSVDATESNQGMSTRSSEHQETLNTDNESNPSRPKTPPAKISSPPRTPNKRPDITYLSRTPSRLARSPKSTFKPLSLQPTLLSESSMLSSFAPSTPQKAARDLSSLFDISIDPAKIGTKSSKKLNASGSGIAKRMLSRTQTEPSFDSASGSQSQTSFASNSSHSVSQLPAVSYSRSPSSLNEPKPVVPLTTVATTTSHARTYGGKSRSFLISVPASNIPSLQHGELTLPHEEEDTEIHESYTDLRTRWGVDNSEDDPQPSIYSHSLSPLGSVSQSQSQTSLKLHMKGKGEKPVTYANGLTNDLKSITELRSKGESRRFLDEVGYLLEGLEPTGSLAVRRASALELATKLCVPDFARKAKAADFYVRAWEVMVATDETPAQERDKIISIILAFFGALVSKDQSALNELAHRSQSQENIQEGHSFVHVLFGMLEARLGERGRDGLALVSAGLSDAELKRAGFGRREKAMLTTLSNTISMRSGLISKDVAVSTRFLISRALSNLHSSLISTHHVTALIQTLRAELSLFPLRVSAYTSGLAILPSRLQSVTDTPCFDHVENCLKLLDAFLLGRWSCTEEQDYPRVNVIDNDRETGLSHELLSLCIVAELVCLSSDYNNRHLISQKCIVAAFRTLLTLTQDDVEWCRALIANELTLGFIMRMISGCHRQRSSMKSKAESESTAFSAEDDRDTQVLDRLCLALGLLTNLVNTISKSKDVIRALKIDPLCSVNRRCLPLCSCPNASSSLNILVQVYASQRQGSPDLDPGTIFLRGHAAILLGLALRGSSANQKVVLAALPGSSPPKKLVSLAKCAREFATFYAELTTQLSLAAESEDHSVGAGSSRRGCHSNSNIREGNSYIAHEIALFLEDLSVK